MSSHSDEARKKKTKNQIETYIFWSVLTEEAHDELLLMGQTHSSALGWYPHSKKVKHKSANSQIQTDCVEPKGQDPMNKPQVFSDEWVTAIWAGWQIHADRKNCSSLFPPLRYSNSFIFLFIFTGYRLINHCLGREQLSKFQKASNAIIMNIKAEDDDTVFLLKTVTIYMYGCINTFAKCNNPDDF